MSRPQPPKPAKLVISLLLKNKDLIIPVTNALAEKFGDVDIVSKWLSFDFTTYYEPEMGTPLFRRMLAFKTLIEQSALAEIKLTTNSLEQEFSSNGKRMINLDPGYLLQERFVLASGKNFSHRIYIGRHIYADLTLIFVKGRFQTLPWTYPDYADETMFAYLTMVRQKYAIDLRWAKNQPGQDGVMES